jgi:hypothetical protein
MDGEPVIKLKLSELRRPMGVILTRSERLEITSPLILILSFVSDLDNPTL